MFPVTRVIVQLSPQTGQFWTQKGLLLTVLWGNVWSRTFQPGRWPCLSLAGDGRTPSGDSSCPDAWRSSSPWVGWPYSLHSSFTLQLLYECGGTCAPGKGSSSQHAGRCVLGETTEQTSPGYVSSGNQKMDWIFSMDSLRIWLRI